MPLEFKFKEDMAMALARELCGARLSEGGRSLNYSRHRTDIAMLVFPIFLRIDVGTHQSVDTPFLTR